MLPRSYSPEAVRCYLKRIRLAQQSGLTNFDEVFDPAIYKLIKSHADAIGSPREAILCSLLVAVAGCMGPKTDVRVDSDWLEKTILWVLVAGRRGDCKTPALNRVKSAVAGLEREIQALHRAKTSQENVNSHYPPFLVDEHNFRQVDEYLKMSSASHNVIGMFDNFGSFLRHCPGDSVFMDPNVLLSMFESTLNLTNPDNSKDRKGIHFCNFLGMIEAIDAAALLEHFDADGLSDRVHVVCPKASGCKQILETSQDSHGNQTALQVILSTIRNYHHVQNVCYTFREDGRAVFQRCLAELDLWQSGFVYDERRRGVLAKAPGQLARLSAVLCALKNGLDLTAHGSNGHLIPATAITADTVNSARQILMYLINQKMSFLPNDESLVEENSWDDMAETIRIETNSPSSVDIPEVIHKPIQEAVYLPRRENPATVMSAGASQDNAAHEIRARSRDHSEGGAVPIVHEPCQVSAELLQSSRHDGAFSRSVVSPSVVALLNSDISSTVNPPEDECIEKRRIAHRPKRERESEGTGGDVGSVKVMKASQDGTHSSQDNVMVYSIEDDSDNGSEGGRDIQGVRDNRSPAAPGVESNFAGVYPGSNSWNIEEIHDGDFCRSANNVPKFELVPNSFRSFRTSINMFQLTDDQLITQCAQKIKKLLLLPGMIASSASICQKRLFPPVPKELRVEHPRTTHPVWGALAFLKRLVHLGLGELVHPLYRMQAIHFRKIRLEYMRPESRALLKRIDLDEEEYERSYPKFDDSHLTTFVLIEDIDRAVSQRLKADGQTIRRY